MRAKLFLWSAAVFCAMGVVLHEFFGSPTVLPPLSDTQLPDSVIWLHRFSWHVDSVAVAGMGALFACAARAPGNVAMAVIASAMSLGFALLGIGHAIGGSEVLWRTPAPYVWTVIALTGGFGALMKWREGWQLAQTGD